MTLKSYLFAAAVLLGTAACSGCSGDPDWNLLPKENGEQPTVVRDETIASAKILPGQTKNMKYSVYLPAGYTAEKSYPILYLLHGYGGNQNSWLDDGKASSYTSAAIDGGTVCPMVIVMPDGMNAFYTDGYQDGMQYETYFFEELLPAVEAKYNAGGSRSKRAVAGLSMGGFGASYYALKHPDMFCLCYAMSGAFSVEGIPSLYEIVNGYTDARRAQFPAFTMEVGTEDQVPGLYDSNVAFDAFLTEKGLEHTFVSRPGIHEWVFWTVCYPKTLAALGAVWGK